MSPVRSWRWVANVVRRSWKRTRFGIGFTQRPAHVLEAEDDLPALEGPGQDGRKLDVVGIIEPSGIGKTSRHLRVAIDPRRCGMSSSQIGTCRTRPDFVESPS
jgi:hypothetical protein